MKRNDIELKVFYIRANDKERLLRQLNREEFPNVHEIIRRFHTDHKDFESIVERIPMKFIKNDGDVNPTDASFNVINNCADWLLEDKSE